MSKLSVINNVKKSFGKTGLQVKRHAPEILIATGVVSVVTSTVLACKATTKLDSILAESKTKIDQIHNYVEENGYSEKYSEEDSTKDLVIVYTHTALDVVKLYAPAVILGAVGLTAIISSHKILRSRNMALAATVTAIGTNFKDYRGRVVQRFGEELDRELRYDIKTTEIEETVVDEKGKEKTVKKTINVVNDPAKYSVYARFFDESCIGWDKNAEYNLMFLKRTQDYANDLLRANGHLFLNDVYVMLGLQKTAIGQQVGWIYDEKNPIGDNFVDFGIYDVHNEKARDFVNGYERVFLLDFNVDGDVLNCLA